jgi:hypothetical protein
MNPSMPTRVDGKSNILRKRETTSSTGVAKNDVETTTISASNIMYSLCRRDRAGSAIADMVFAHSYAYLHNLTYGGACCTHEAYPRTETKPLLQEMFLADILPFACPPNSNLGPHLQMFLNELKFNTETDLIDTNVTKIKSTTSLLSPFVYHSDMYRDNAIKSFPLQYRHYLQALRHTAKNKFQSDTMVGMFDERVESSQVEIAVHIRRGDVKPCKNVQRYLPNAHYLSLIDEYSEILLQKHYNQSESDEPPNIHVTIY